MRPNWACGTGEERGVALVEFALVAPILLVILLAVLDFGKAFNYWIDETQLASAGARWAVVNKLVPGSPALRCDKSTPVKTPASLQEFIDKLDAPRNVWIMVPAAFVDATIASASAAVTGLRLNALSASSSTSTPPEPTIVSAP